MFTFKQRTTLATLVFKPQREWALSDVIDVLKENGLAIDAQSLSTRTARSDVIEVTTATARILISRTNDDQVTFGIETDGDADAEMEAIIAPLAVNFALSACIWAPKTKVLTFEALDAAAEEVRRVRFALPRPIRLIPTPMQEAVSIVKKVGAALLNGQAATHRTDP